MFNRPFDNILGTPAKVAVLRVLSSVTAPMTGRAIEVVGEIAHAACLRALNELVIAQVIVCEQYGREKLYQLNRKSILVEEGLIPLFHSEDLRRAKLFRQIVQWLTQPKLKVLHASVFGSVARKDDHLGSDLDLLLIVNSSKDKNSLLESWMEQESTVNKTFSVKLSPYVLIQKDFHSRYKGGDPFIHSAIQDGHTLVGPTLKELVYEKVQH